MELEAELTTASRFGGLFGATGFTTTTTLAADLLADARFLPHLVELPPTLAAGLGALATVATGEALYLGHRVYAAHRERARYERVDPDDPLLPRYIEAGSPVHVVYEGPDESPGNGFQIDPSEGRSDTTRHIERVWADMAAEQYLVLLAGADTVTGYLDADAETERYWLWLDGQYQEPGEGGPEFQIGFMGESPEMAALYTGLSAPTKISDGARAASRYE